MKLIPRLNLGCTLALFNMRHFAFSHALYSLFNIIKFCSIDFRPFDCGAWWVCGKFGALHPEGRRFVSHSSRLVGTLGKSFTHSCLQTGMSLSSSGLEEAL